MSNPRRLLVPWMTASLDRIEKAIGMKVKSTPGSPLGCGSFGCVYELEDPRWVLKLSSDPFEGPLTKAVIDIRKSEGGGDGYGPSTVLPGIVFYKSLFVDKTAGTPIFVIVRESVIPFRDDDQQQMHWYFHPLKAKPEAANPLDITKDVSEDFFESKDPEAIRTSLELWIKYVGAVGVDLPLVADAMIDLLDRDILLRDVHWGNVGYTVDNWGRKFRPKGSVVIFDLGMSKTGPVRVPALPDGGEQQRARLMENLMGRVMGKLLRDLDVKSVPDGFMRSKLELDGWPDVTFSVQGGGKYGKGHIRAVWKSGETWTSELLNGRNPREARRTRRGR